MANSVVSFASRHTGLNDAAADSDSFDVASSGVGRWKDNARRNVDGFIRLLNDAPPMTSSPAISVLVTSIEYLQLLSLLFLADDPIGWRGSAARAFGPVIGASRLDMITDRPSIALAWTVQVAIVAVAIIAPMAGSRHRRKVAIGAAATTVIAGVSHMATTILFVPIICILINSTACGSAASCYEAQHIAVVTGAMITLIVFSAYSVTIVAIVFEQRPLKSQITAGPHRTANIARVILILTTAIMLGMGQSLPVAVVITFLLAITLQAIFVAYLFAMTLPYYSIRYAQFTAACAWIVAWAATCKLVNAFTSGASSDAGAFVAFVAGIPLIAFAAVLISEVRRSAVATRAPAQLKSALEFEMKIRLLLQYDGDHDKLAEAEQLWTDALSRFPNSVSMYMYRGAFYQHRMHRPFLALKMYSKAASISKVILDQILCRRGMDSVAETQESSEGTHVLRFESNLALARKQDAEATNTLISFWDEVGQDTPNVVQLRLLMGKMSEEMSKTETLYESVFDSFSDDIYSLRAYAGFMLYVVKDTTRGNELLEQANALEDAVSKQTTSASRIQGGSKGAANEAVVLLSVDDGDLGAIVNISAKACTMIGRVKSDLVRRHFAMVTPLAFHKRIVDLFETLAENMDTESFDTGQRLPMLHASGALLVATLSLKCVVDDERLHILGTICPEPDANAVAMVEIQADTSKPPVLICCTNDFGAFFGIDPDAVSQKRLPITNWIPRYVLEHEQLMGQHGCDTLVEMQGEDRVDSITATVCVEQLDVGDGKVEFVQLVCRGEGEFHRTSTPEDGHRSVNEESADAEAQGLDKMTGSASERSAEGSEESGDGEEASQTASSTDAPEETIETEASEDSTVVSDESSEEPESDVPTATRNTARSRADEVALAVDAQRRARRSQLGALRLDLLLSIVIACAAGVAMHTWTASLLASWTSNLIAIDNVGMLRYLDVSIAMMVYAFKSGKTGSRQTLASLGDEMNLVGNAMFADRFNWGSEQRRLAFGTSLSVEKLINGTVVIQQSTQWDATRTAALYARMIANEANVSDRHSFFLLNNYRDPMMLSYNASAFSHDARAAAILFSLNQTVIAIVIVSCIVIFALTLFVIRPIVWQAEHEAVEFLVRILETPGDLIALHREQAQSHLEFLIDATQLSKAAAEQQEKQNWGRRDSQRRRKRRDLEKRLLRESLRERIRLMMKIFIPMAVMLAYFLAFYEVGIAGIEPVISHASSEVNWASYRRAVARQVLFALSTAAASNASTDVTGPIDELARVHNNLVYGSAAANTVSLVGRATTFQSHTDLTFGNPCGAGAVDFSGGSCAQAFGGLLTNGLHVAVLDYVAHAQFAAHNLRQRTFGKVGPLIDRLWQMETLYLQDLMQAEMNAYMSSVNALVSQQHGSWALAILLVFAVVTVGVYWLVLMPLVSDVAAHETRIKRMANLLPDYR